MLLWREGFTDDHKRVCRLYLEQGLLLLLKRPKRKKAAQPGQPNAIAAYANQVWGMDFVADNLFDG